MDPLLNWLSAGREEPGLVAAAIPADPRPIFGVVAARHRGHHPVRGDLPDAVGRAVGHVDAALRIDGHVGRPLELRGLHGAVARSPPIPSGDRRDRTVGQDAADRHIVEVGHEYASVMVHSQPHGRSGALPEASPVAAPVPVAVDARQSRQRHDTLPGQRGVQTDVAVAISPPGAQAVIQRQANHPEGVPRLRRNASTDVDAPAVPHVLPDAHLHGHRGGRVQQRHIEGDVSVAAPPRGVQAVIRRT